jgi:hypothetical protein
VLKPVQADKLAARLSMLLNIGDPA